MGKSKQDYWKQIRIPIPPPGKAMPTEKDYNRKRDKKVFEEDDDD